MTTTAQVVRNLCGRWAATLAPGEDAMFSGSSAFGILGMLADAADGQAREELGEALGTDPGECAAQLAQLFGGLDDAVVSALGVWFHNDVELRPEWQALYPFATIAPMPEDPAAYDQWVSTATGGLIDKAPVQPDETARLVGASAVALDILWETPFTPGLSHWPDSRPVVGLSREMNADDVGVLSVDDAQFSHVVVASASNVDVHLIAGAEGDGPDVVLAAALAWFGGHGSRIASDQLAVDTAAGALTVSMGGGEPSTRVSIPAFSIAGSTDLCELAAVFGLEAAMDDTRGHFPAISDFPLAVSKVKQTALAQFSATGFKAAAVTMMAVAAGGVPRELHRRVRVHHERPFAFLAVDRVTDVVHFAGWVATADAMTEFADAMEALDEVTTP